MSIKYNVFIQKEDEWYIAKCLENNVASQGKTIEEAIKNLLATGLINIPTEEDADYFNENEEEVNYFE